MPPMTSPLRAGLGRPPVLSGEERRRVLLDAAEIVFLSAGYRAATMDGIARQAGMSKKTIYQVVESKAELFEALLTDRFHPITVDVKPDDRPLSDQLIDLLRHLADFCLAPRQVAITRLMIAEAPQTGDMAAALAHLGLITGNGPLARWVKAQVERGALPPRDTALSGDLLFYAVVGEALLSSLVRLSPPPAPDVMERRIEAAVRMFLADYLVSEAVPAAALDHVPPEPKRGKRQAAVKGVRTF